MEIHVSGITVDEVLSNNEECWPVTNLKFEYKNYFVDVDVKIHCKKNTHDFGELLFHDPDDEEPNVIVDVMDTEITVNKNNCFKMEAGSLTEARIESALRGYAIEMFAGDIMYAIINDIEERKKDYLIRLLSKTILGEELATEIAELIF
jgi:hypothetical protein